MPVLFIPALVRDLTGGLEKIEVPGETLREAIDALDERFPGIKARLVEDDQLRPHIAVFVDGQQSRLRMRHKLEEKSEVHFLPAMSGGCER